MEQEAEALTGAPKGVRTDLCEKQPKLGAMMDGSREDVLAYMDFLQKH